MPETTRRTGVRDEGSSGVLAIGERPNAMSPTHLDEPSSCLLAEMGELKPESDSWLSMSSWEEERPDETSGRLLLRDEPMDNAVYTLEVDAGRVSRERVGATR